ncbi:LD-carboxypeptidase [Fusibacter sp. 3D3]|uniref:S66 peptidase family protein n=1 Tax=Fusibacter sp. 3D3 TaxID=1048380 RepID=UPI00085381F1|nr:LD-carboxypeptidase [Fusibacter sp. 3D3]GAU77819.1 muramoyltetrapeptide carboxypeptidase [Fusibacter sp. 3D3]
MQFPNPLKKGDQVAVLCPSTPTNEMRVHKAEAAMKVLGFEPVMYPSCYAYHGHLSGSDALRAKDINDAFLDDRIKGIICLKGGSGATRLLKLLDYEQIAKHPKVFMGFSDITALHIVLNQKCDLATFHGPMASSDVFVDEDHACYQDMYTLESFRANLMTLGFKGILKNPIGEDFITLVPGKCSGELIGGNLSLLISTLGSPYELDTKGKVLFIEEVSEPNYKIDKMLTALALAGKFNDCEGIILGTFSDCNPESKGYGGTDLDLDTIFREVLMPFGKPILANLRAGHNFPQPTLAFGKVIHLDATEQIIEF